MEREGACRKEHLASMASSVIYRCRCGIYHVRVNGTTLHLTTSQFNATARLFKLALGMLTGQFDPLSSPLDKGGKRGVIDVGDNINYVKNRGEIDGLSV